METVVPWAKLVACIEPFYFKGERGRKQVGLERMLRMYFLQQWYALADEGLEDALYDSQSISRFGLSNSGLIPRSAESSRRWS
jgi:IS5 family transposase